MTKIGTVPPWIIEYKAIISFYFYGAHDPSIPC